VLPPFFRLLAIDSRSAADAPFGTIMRPSGGRREALRALRYIAPVPSPRFRPVCFQALRNRSNTPRRAAMTACPYTRFGCILRIAAGALAGAVMTMTAGCDSHRSLPDPASADYRKTVAAFHVGVAALQVGDDATADSHLAEVTRLAPGEPAGWANWALLALRQRNFDVAAVRLDRAQALVPKNAHVSQLQGILERNRGRAAEALAQLRKAVDIDPRDLRSRYALAQEIERQGGPAADEQFQRQIEQILAVQPANLAALLELARVSAKRGDRTALSAALARIGASSPGWPDDVRTQLAAAGSAAASSSNARTAATRVTLLRNVLVRMPAYRDGLEAIKAPPGEEAAPFTQFVRLAPPLVMPAPADTAIAFESSPVALTGTSSAATPGERFNWIGALQLASEGAPVVAVANAHEVRLASGPALPFPGGAADTQPSPAGILQIDFDYDFKTDLVLAGAGGVRWFRQKSPESFYEVTAATRLPRAIVDAHYDGAWAADIEADGDLDIVLGAHAGPPIVLQNNGDGTFTAIHPFDGIDGLRQFAWADFDGDGNPDAAMIDAVGHLHLYVNARQGVFHEQALPIDARTAMAMTVADIDGDGVLDLVTVRDDGTLLRISSARDAQRWNAAQIARVPNATSGLAGEVRLRAADLDNNGAIDLVLSQLPSGSEPGRTLVWLGDTPGRFTLVERSDALPPVFDIADVDGDGKLDLLALAGDGSARSWLNAGTRNYHWQVVRPRAAQAFGDQRINPFGVGGEIEIRAGQLLQRQPIDGPQVHFGLGNETQADVVRVLWPNGTVRAEFDVKSDQSIETEQRLKGSCPFLFAWNGKEIAFVKDAVPWGSAIGLRINTLGTAAVAATEEWYRIGRDALVPHDGYYDLRITGELWEVYYYDQLALMTVDHPAGTEVFVDERFVIPPAKLAITAVETPRPLVHAIDDAGHDVTALLRARDGKAVAGFEPGQYQGIAREHYLELDLGDDVPASGPLYLIANGSVYPTDSSLNVALSQGERWRAHGLVLDVPDGRGGWTVARATWASRRAGARRYSST